MERKSKKSKAPSGKGPIEVDEAEVGKAKPVPPKESTQTVTPQNAADAAVSAVRQFYDKLSQLPLDEKAPALYSHYLITQSTLERVGKSCHVRMEKNGFILQDVLVAVQQKPDLLVVFCNLLQDIYIAAELAQLIKDKYDEEVVNLKDTATHNTTSTKTGPATFEKFLQGKGAIVVLVLLLAVALAPWYTMNYHDQIPRPGPYSGKRPSLPDLPTAFTGRSDEIYRLIRYVMTEHVSIVAVTGGPGYGKSSLAIVSSHEVVRRGIPVYYVSLSEVTNIETFIMAFLHATDKRKTEQMPERRELLSWISALETKTVVVLDNADLLTLRQTDLRNEFLKLLKDAVAGSEYLYLVVATRYRFKFANDFEEIHLNPLTSTEAVALLRCVVLTSEKTIDTKDAPLEDEHLSGIANKTGGIPLALKVVGILLKSGIVSTTEVLDELTEDPLHALSRESFTPDEQLKRCFSLSYKYLSQTMRKCLTYASRFPGTFDRQARDAIITSMTGDAHCLDQLVDRSLVEYSTVEERYTMHSLLRTFVANSVTERPPKQKYFRIFCNHFILLLSTCITEARSGGDINRLYNTITADYHNFLHLLHIYTSVSRDHPLLPHKEMLQFANQAFDVMKSRFPWESLVEWWTAVLNNVCRMVYGPDFELLAPVFLQLSTKFGNLLLHHKQYKVAGDILLFADQCVGKDANLAEAFVTCQHPQAESYTNMLQALMRVLDEDGVVHKARQVRERLYYCIDSAPEKTPHELLPIDFCTVGIKYLQEKYSQRKDFHSALQLFDAHFGCFSLVEAGTDELIIMLENAYVHGYSHDQVTRAFLIAERCQMVMEYKKEAAWLMKAAKFLGKTPVKDKGLLMVAIHFRLTKLQWMDFHDAKKAVKHGRIAYSLAIKSPDRHTDIWKTSLRLADILHQIDGRQTEAGFYFEEALKHSPFVDPWYMIFLDYQHFAELHLISIHYHAGQHRQCIQHYGQWAKLEVASASDHARKIVAALFSEPLRIWVGSGRSLAVTDSSLDWLFGDFTIAKRFIDAFMQKAHESTMFYSRIFDLAAFILVCAFIGLIILTAVACISVISIRVSTHAILNIHIAYFIILPHFSFHYFLFYALTQHRGLWVPRQLPQIPPLVTIIYVISILLSAVMAILAASLFSFFGFYLFAEQIKFIYSPSLYYNLTMYLDDSFYNLLVLR